MRLLFVAFTSAAVGTADVGLAAVDAARNRALALCRLSRLSRALIARVPSMPAPMPPMPALSDSSGAVSFTHFFNYYEPSDALHQTELRLVLRSWGVARKQAVNSGLKLEHLACILEGDSSEGLPAFIHVAPLPLRDDSRARQTASDCN